MISESEARSLINEVFEEETLVIGGLIAVHEVEDDLVWRLFRNLDLIRNRALNRLERRTGNDGKQPERRTFTEPHPAIEEFLAQLGRTVDPDPASDK
jgi:hypothetical protein